MPEFGDFGERSPEEIEFLERALEHIGGSVFTIRQLDRFLISRSEELPEDADDVDRTDYYAYHDPRFETAVKAEYDSLITAAEGLATYYAAQKKTHEIHTTIEREASSLIIAANRIASSEDISAADFTTEG